MEKRKMITGVLAATVAAMLLCGCTTADAVSQGNSSAAASVSESSQAQEAELSYEMKLYTQAPNTSSSVSIEYPAFSGKGSDEINAMIEAAVSGIAYIDEDSLGKGTGVDIDYSCEITLMNTKMLSVVFWGDSEVENSAHPYSEIESVNIDLAAMKQLYLTDIYDCTGSFATIYSEKAAFPSDPVTSYDAESFSAMFDYFKSNMEFDNPFSDTEDLLCFLKDDGVVISAPAVHATGSDHIEAQLRYEDIAQCCRLTDGYWKD